MRISQQVASVMNKPNNNSSFASFVGAACQTYHYKDKKIFKYLSMIFCQHLLRNVIQLPITLYLDNSRQFQISTNDISSISSYKCHTLLFIWTILANSNYISMIFCQYLLGNVLYYPLFGQLLTFFVKFRRSRQP